jgi:hypothetical protein
MRPDETPNATARDALVSALLAESSGNPLITVDEAARALRVERGYLYRRVEDLGGIRLGAGPKAPIRFPAAILAERILAAGAPPSEPPQAPRARKRRRGTSETHADLLPVRDRFAAARPGAQ